MTVHLQLPERPRRKPVVVVAVQHDRRVVVDAARAEQRFEFLQRNDVADDRVAEFRRPVPAGRAGNVSLVVGRCIHVDFDHAQPGIMERLRGFGAVVIWLDCPANLLLARCATMNNRPLFRDEASFRTLLAARLPFYEQADYRVAGDDDPASVVARILALPAFAKRLTNLGEELSARRVKP